MVSFVGNVTVVMHFKQLLLVTGVMLARPPHPDQDDIGPAIDSIFEQFRSFTDIDRLLEDGCALATQSCEKRTVYSRRTNTGIG